MILGFFFVKSEKFGDQNHPEKIKKKYFFLLEILR